MWRPHSGQEAPEEDEIKKNQIKFGKFQIKLKDEDVYLGGVISAQGLKASIVATIRKRAGKVRGAMFKVKAIMSDYRMQAVGGMAEAWATCSFTFSLK
jgi:hypothetical protein